MTAKQRRLWQEHCRQRSADLAMHLALMEVWERLEPIGEWYGAKPALRAVELPVELRGLRCGAKNRRGVGCRSKELAANGRCRFHGGASTGPKSDAGKARAQANLALRWTRRAS